MTVPSFGVFKASLVVLQYLGAAAADATQEQRDRLKEETIPLLRDESLTVSEAYKGAVMKAKEIMGEDWEPREEWALMIDALIAETET